MGKGKRQLQLLRAAALACLAMGASEPQGEGIDSRRYGAEATVLVKPYPIRERPGALVTVVRGMVQWRAGEDKPWAVIRLGDRIEGEAEFRTGIRSSLTLSVGEEQTITIDRLGLVKLLRIEADGKVRFELDRGRMKRQVQPDGPQDGVIGVPGSTVAIRG